MNVSKCLCVALSFYTSTSLAWNYQGHQIIGEIADTLIAGSNAERHVRDILGDGVTLKTVSVWADCVKSVRRNDNNGSFYYQEDGKYAECDIFKDRTPLVDYVKRNWDQCTAGKTVKNCHGYYHFTDVAIQRDAYQQGEYGTSDYDVVQAINAAIRVLQGGAAPAPFNIADKKEALQLLVHFVGDETQPLHVAAIYLNDQGQPIDPDHNDHTQGTDTRGGNDLIDSNTSLHALWDMPPKRYTEKEGWKALLPGATAISAPAGDLSDWPAQWASDTLVNGRTAFRNVVFGKKTGGSWPVGHQSDYTAQREALQATQLEKGGAHLAWLLKALWPDN